MKKIVLMAIASLVFSAAAMAGSANNAASADDTKRVMKKKRVAFALPAENERTFHVVELSKAENKYVVMIGKKPNTKVSLAVFDKNGSLLYKEVTKANRDSSKILNLGNHEGAVIRISDSNGVEKDYTF